MNDSSKACILCIFDAWDVLAPVGTEFRAVLLITRISPDLDDQTSIGNSANHVAMLILL
jgi:hypothetical protein